MEEASGDFDDDDEGPSDTCQFCGLHDANFTDDTLDYHFWQDCPMLTDCKYCGQVNERPACDCLRVLEWQLVPLRVRICGPRLLLATPA